jgi:hypothetical protein
MLHLPVYLWAMTYAAIAGMVAAAAYVLYRGARRADLGARRSAGIGGGAFVVLGGWLAASSVIGAQGRYHTRLGHGLPWLPIAVVGFFSVLMALSRLPSVSRALTAPGGLSRLMLPHRFRMEGIVFIVAMLLGKLPALFAVPAGLGDIAIGLATPRITRKLDDGSGDRAAVWFNVFGMADLINALVLGGLTAFRIVSVSPSASLNSELPLVLVPTVGVPLLLALHIRSLTLLRSRTTARHPLEVNAEPLAALSNQRSVSSDA